MALATTCPQCKTSFKVVPDQLKLRRGLVRCGVCQHVFSGIDHLRYVDDAARAAQRQARAQAAAEREVPGPIASPRAPGAVGDLPPREAGEHPSGGTASGASAPVASSPVAPSPVAPSPVASSPVAPSPVASAPADPANVAAAPSTTRASTLDIGDTVGPAAAPTPPPRPVEATAPPPGGSPSLAEVAAAAAAAAAATPAPDTDGASPPAPSTPTAASSPGDMPATPTPADLDAGPRTRTMPGAWTADAPPRTDLPAPARPGLPAPSRASTSDPDGPRTVNRAPAWPATASGPQTIIDADDLKTAFFLSDSAFGPQIADPRDPPTRVARQPSSAPLPGVGALASDPPTGIGPTRSDPRTRFGPRPADPPTRIGSPGAAPAPLTTAPSAPLPMRPEGPVTVVRAGGAPPTVLRPEVDPLAGFQTDPLPAVEADDATRLPDTSGSPLRDAAISADNGEPAIDYFAPRRGRSRSLGLALSPGAWAAAGLLAVLLAGQMLLGWRDAIAARVPPLAPVLSLVGAPFGLEVAPPRDIAALTIESFELQSAASPNLLQLTAVLRNRSGHVVAFPAMELTLTDSVGAVLVRKVIPADAYLPDAATAARGLAERSEWPLRLALEHRGLQPTGYSVALFHP